MIVGFLLQRSWPTTISSSSSTIITKNDLILHNAWVGTYYFGISIIFKCTSRQTRIIGVIPPFSLSSFRVPVNVPDAEHVRGNKSDSAMMRRGKGRIRKGGQGLRKTRLMAEEED